MIKGYKSKVKLYVKKGNKSKVMVYDKKVINQR